MIIKFVTKLITKELPSTGWPKNLETWKKLEFDNLGKQKNLEFLRKIMEKPGSFFNLNFLTTSI